MNSNDESALNSFSIMSHVNVNIGGCVCLSGCLKCIYEKGFRNEKKQNTFWRIWLLSKPHYSHVSGQYFMIISSLRKKMLSYISSVHLWPAYQSMRDFWVRGFWKNLRLGINPEHLCIKTKMFSSTCILTLKVLHVCIFIMTCWLLHLQAVFFKKKKRYTSTH